jgi:hypothetical protein
MINIKRIDRCAVDLDQHAVFVTFRPDDRLCDILDVQDFRGTIRFIDSSFHG